VKGVPEQHIWNSWDEAPSTRRVIENGLNVTFPAPAPVDWDPMLRVCSTSKL
jgi:hypothetical protein